MLNTPNLFSTAEHSEARPSEAVSDFVQALQPVLEAMLPSLLTLIETPDHVPSALAVLNRSYSSRWRPGPRHLRPGGRAVLG
jgi:hypothetical protein